MAQKAVKQCKERLQNLTKEFDKANEDEGKPKN